MCSMVESLAARLLRSARYEEALARGTEDAVLWYHAGMIARATGDDPHVVCPPHRWSEVAMAPPNGKIYGNALLGGPQLTGGSTSVRDGWDKLRLEQAGPLGLRVTVALRRQGDVAAVVGTVAGVVRHAPNLLAAREPGPSPASGRTGPVWWIAVPPPT